MNKLFCSFSFLFMCFLISSTVHSTPIYRIVDLGLQESDQSEAVAVNDKGQVAGSYWMLGTKYSFLWNERDGISLIDLPETAAIVVMNNQGHIAGNYIDSSGRERGFFWDKQNGFFDIGSLGGNFTHIYDMNDRGQIVGQSECVNASLVDGESEQHAFLWEKGNIFDLGALVGELGLSGDRSKATGINNLGQIVGESNALFAHKRKLLRTNNRAVFWQNRFIEEIDISIDSRYNSTSLFVNNSGLVTCMDGHSGNFVFDLLTKNKSKIQHLNSRVVELHDNGDVFLFNFHNYFLKKKIADVAYFKKRYIENNYGNFNTYDHVHFATSFNNSQNWKPDSFEGAYDFNNKRWVVGVAENVYGEKHAVLLVPIVE